MRGALSRSGSKAASWVKGGDGHKRRGGIHFRILRDWLRGIPPPTRRSACTQSIDLNVGIQIRHLSKCRGRSSTAPWRRRRSPTIWASQCRVCLIILLSIYLTIRKFTGKPRSKARALPRQGVFSLQVIERMRASRTLVGSVNAYMTRAHKPSRRQTLSTWSLRTPRRLQTPASSDGKSCRSLLLQQEPVSDS